MAKFKTVFLLGRSNVGKSSVIRGLTGRKVPAGRRPGVTTRSRAVEKGSIRYVDMPGFGFMSGTPSGKREETKTWLVHEIETRRDDIDLAILVVDARAFGEICDRWEARGEIPVDVEMHDFLRDLEIPLLVAANRIDRVLDLDEALDGICSRLGYVPPWRQWMDVVIPTSAKTGEGIDALRREISRKVGLN